MEYGAGGRNGLVRGFGSGWWSPHADGFKDRGTTLCREQRNAPTSSIYVASIVEGGHCALESGQVAGNAGDVLQRWGMSLKPDMQTSGRGRPYCRPCMDWSERKMHIAGRLGAMIRTHCLEQGWLTRKTGSRALSISAAGASTLRDLLGLEAWHRVTDPA